MSIEIKKNSCLTGLQLQQYIQTILNCLKAVAFHEIYMENQRRQLCRTEHFDYLTAFKTIDSFKHNKIVGFQLKNFLALQECGKVNVTQDQCQQVLTCINKSLLGVTYEDFQQITLPYDVALRNLSLARYNQLQVGVGTMGLIYQVKSTSSKKISQYFLKEVDFYRELLLRKQNFCQKFGGDLYTFWQLICKGKQRKFGFQNFYKFCREYKVYFNKDEFVAIYKRTKSVSHLSPLFYDQPQKIFIEVQSLSHLLLASTQKLNVKQKIRIIDGIYFDHIKQPSYKSINFKTREQQQKAQNQYEAKQKLISQERLNDERDKRDMRYKYTFPDQHIYPFKQRNQLRDMNRKWAEHVQTMGTTQISIRYHMFDKKRYFI